MNYKISLREMDRLGAEKLSTQSRLTLGEKRKQAQELKKGGPKFKKQKP